MSITSYAQNFEDVVLWRALREVENGAYLDIGAHDPVVDSVSKAFYDAGWRGVHVEPEPEAAEKLREARPDETVLEVAVDKKPQKLTLYSFAGTGLSTGVKEIAEKHQSDGRDPEEIKVKTKTLSAILNQMEAPEIHWMKVDVEGMETAVLSSWGNATARPWIVLVESTVPNSKKEADLSWEKELTSRGYSFVRFDGLNRFYVHEDHKDLEEPLSISPNVFDGFVISDTSSSSFSASIKKAKEAAKALYRKQIKDLTKQIEDKERLVAEEQQRSRDTDDASLRERQIEIERLNNELHQLKALLKQVEADRHRLNETITSQATALARASEQISPEIADKLLQREAELQRAILHREHADSRFQMLQERLDAETQHKLELVKGLEQRLAQLSETSDEERKSLSADLIRLRAEKDDLSREIEQLKGQHKSNADELSRMHSEYDKLVAHLDVVERAHRSETEKLQERLEEESEHKLDLTKELELRLAELEELAAASEAQRGSHEAEIAALQAEKKEAAEQIKRLESKGEENAGDLSRLRDEYDKLASQLDALERSHRSEMEALQQRLDEEHKHKLELKEELELQIAELEALRAEKKEAAEQIRTLELQGEESAGELSRARDEYDKLASHLDAVERSHRSEMEKLQKRLDEEHNHKLELKEELELQLTELAAAAEAERESLEADIANLKAEKKETDYQIKKLQDTHETERSMLQDKNAVLNETIGRLEKDRDAQGAEVARLVSEIERQEAYLVSIRENHRQSSEALAKARDFAMQMYEEGEQETKAQRAENDRLSNLLEAQAENYDQRLAEAQAVAEGASRKNKQLSAIVENQRSEREVEVANLERKLALARQREAQISGELHAKDAQVSRLREELEQSRQTSLASLSDVETALVSEREGVRERDERLHDVSNRLEIEHATRVHLQHTIAEKEEQLSRSEASLGEKDSQISELNERLRQITLEVEEARNRERTYQEMVAEMQNSSSWKMTALARWIRRKLPGS